MAAQVKRIIEYQEDRQRTPRELLQFLSDQIDRGRIKRMLVTYITSDDLIGYAAAAENRDYKKSEIFWDYEQWKRWFLSHDQ